MKLTERVPEAVKERANFLLKPHEYQLLLMSLLVGITTEQGLDYLNLDVKDVPGDFLSAPIVIGSILTAVLSAYRFSTGEEGEIASRAKVEEIMHSLWQEGDALKGACDMMLSDYRCKNKEIEEKNEKVIKELQLRLKSAFLAKILLVSSVIRGEKGQCFNAFVRACEAENRRNDDSPDSIDVDLDDDRAAREHFYQALFARAIEDVKTSGDFDEAIDPNNPSLIVEVINKLEDYYNHLFVEYANLVGPGIASIDECFNVSDRTVKPEIALLNFLKAKARKRKAWFYGLVALSAVSLNRTEDFENLNWLNDYFVKDLIDWLAAHANAIVGTTATFIGLRALATINTSLAPAQFLARRLAPSAFRVRTTDEQ